MWKKKELSQACLFRKFHVTLSELLKSHFSERKFCSEKKENKRQLESLYKQEDPLEKKMATHSNILAWEIPWTGVPGGP